MASEHFMSLWQGLKLAHVRFMRQLVLDPAAHEEYTAAKDAMFAYVGRLEASNKALAEGSVSLNEDAYYECQCCNVASAKMERDIEHESNCPVLLAQQLLAGAGGDGE